MSEKGLGTEGNKMKIIKHLTLLILSLILISTYAEARTKRKNITRKNPAKTSKPITKSGDDYKVLARGSYSKVETPFVFAVRDAETYELLRSLIENLPPSSTIDFTKTAVIAAFAGEKTTGGYSVIIHPVADKIAIDVRAPEKGAMTAQVITSPFQAVVIPISASQSLPLEIPSAWTNQMQIYNVTKANFESSGGFAGRTKKFAAEGAIGVFKHENLLTFVFNLTGKEADSPQKLSDVASGVMKEGNIKITRLDAGTFAQMPRPPLKAFGTMNDKKLSFLFESLPATVADGFMVRGSLEANLIKKGD